MSTSVGEPATAEEVVLESVEPPVSTRKRAGIGIALLVVGLVCALGWGLGSQGGRDAGFTLSQSGDAVQIPAITLPAAATGVLLGALVVLLALWQVARGWSRSALRWVGSFAAFAFVLTFLCWASTGKAGQSIDLLGLLQQSIFLAVPLILGALGGVLCERSGVVNVAIEGQLLVGAFAGALVGTVAHNLVAGAVAAMVAGAVLGLLLAVFAIRYLVNQTVLGVVLNVLALGLTGFLFDALMAPAQDSFNNPGVFDPVSIPVLHDIPVLGPLLFESNVIVYATYVLIVVIDVGLYRTRWGLRTRAVGEHPKAADTAGINVNLTRYRNVVLGGFVAGLAGAYLTIGSVGQFTKNISSGNGFIALAAVIFGRWSPRGAVAAALLFGFAGALQTRVSFLQSPVAIPSNLLAMLPYLATLFAVAGLVGRVRAPAADGVPYVKE